MMLVALPIFTKAVTPSEGHQIWQAHFALSEAVLAVTKHFFAFHAPSHTFQVVQLHDHIRYRIEAH